MRPESTARRFTLLSVLVVVVSLAGPAAAWSTNPPHAAITGGSHPSVRRGDTVTAVVVKSWGNCSSSSLIWDDLNANWSLYGQIPIVIDYSNPSICGDSFTLADLEASGANVVILDDPSGGQHQFTSDEVEALRTYASEGHNLLGTFLTFDYPSQAIDNRALAPLFGLRRFSQYSYGPVSAIYELRYPSSPLFINLPRPYVSSGYPETQRPGDGAWSGNELLGRTLVAAENSDGTAAIIVHQETTYSAIYVSNMPEYGGGTDDKQFMYNAIVFPSP